MPSAQVRQKLKHHVSLPLPTAGTAPFLEVPFTLNFTIVNLRYGAELSRPGSRSFKRTEKILQKLVRASPHHALPIPASPAHLT